MAAALSVHSFPHQRHVNSIVCHHLFHAYQLLQGCRHDAGTRRKQGCRATGDSSSGASSSGSDSSDDDTSLQLSESGSQSMAQLMGAWGKLAHRLPPPSGVDSPTEVMLNALKLAVGALQVRPRFRHLQRSI